MMSWEIAVLVVRIAGRDLGVGGLVMRARRRTWGSCRSWPCRRCSSRNHLLSLGYPRWMMLLSVERNR